VVTVNMAKVELVIKYIIYTVNTRTLRALWDNGQISIASARNYDLVFAYHLRAPFLPHRLRHGSHGSGLSLLAMLELSSDDS
jgi:hypothetical protein